jgi:hypothetical protein
MVVFACLAGALVIATATAFAVPTITNFSFRLGAERTLKCSFVVGLSPGPNQARCDGYSANVQGAGALVGGDRAALRAEERKCQALAERYQVGMSVAGLVVDGRGRGAISCVGDAESGGTYLAVGQNISAGPFSCTGLRTGLRCVAKSGHGFFFGRTTWSTF